MTTPDDEADRIWDIFRDLYRDGDGLPVPVAAIEAQLGRVIDPAGLAVLFEAGRWGQLADYLEPAEGEHAVALPDGRRAARIILGDSVNFDDYVDVDDPEKSHRTIELLEALRSLPRDAWHTVDQIETVLGYPIDPAALLQILTTDPTLRVHSRPSRLLQTARTVQLQDGRNVRALSRPSPPPSPPAAPPKRKKRSGRRFDGPLARRLAPLARRWLKSDNKFLVENGGFLDAMIDRVPFDDFRAPESTREIVNRTMTAIGRAIDVEWGEVANFCAASLGKYFATYGTDDAREAFQDARAKRAEKIADRAAAAAAQCRDARARRRNRNNA